MSDFFAAAKAAKAIRQKLKDAEKLAMPGTYSHSQFMSATLLSQYSRIEFCLSVLEKYDEDDFKQPYEKAEALNQQLQRET